MKIKLLIFTLGDVTNCLLNPMQYFSIYSHGDVENLESFSFRFHIHDSVEFSLHFQRDEQNFCHSSRFFEFKFG